jgi:peptidoglycan hydrolase-like protein with peptidoglycan-binding domain
MRTLLASAAALAAGLALAPVARADAPPPLTFVQPLPGQAVQMVQERLRAYGTYTGAVDGVWGPESMAALERFQADRGLQPTGALNEATVSMLGINQGSLLATAASPAPPAAYAEPLRPAAVRNVQEQLRALGFYNGGVDGLWGPGTEQALMRFQQSRGLQPNGQLNPVTASALGLNPNGLAAR